MEQIREMTPVKRKRLLKTFGGPPAGYTNDDLERFLDLLYGLFSDVYTVINTVECSSKIFANFYRIGPKCYTRKMTTQPGVTLPVVANLGSRHTFLDRSR